nr:BTAD domain-containing putative transcriptional regulator [Micromonospora sp. DSM 115978]
MIVVTGELSVAGLHLRLIGPFTVCRQGWDLAPPAAGNRRARRLLALLAVHAGHTVAIDAIVGALWDGRPPREPVPNVATLVSRLRAKLGAQVVRGDRRGGYRLDAAVPVDLHDACRHVTDSRALLAGHRPGPALAAAHRALALLERSSVLTDETDADWAEPARRLHERLLRQARHTAGTAAIDADDLPAALAAAEAAIATDRLDEAAYRVVMSAYQASGEPARALLAYERLRVALAEELGTGPAPATRSLHLRLLR